MPADARAVAGATAHVFPPALVPVLRERFASSGGSLAEISDGVLIELLTTIFFAGLATYEGEHHPIDVVFLGRSSTTWSSPTRVVLPIWMMPLCRSIWMRCARLYARWRLTATAACS